MEITNAYELQKPVSLWTSREINCWLKKSVVYNSQFDIDGVRALYLINNKLVERFARAECGIVKEWAIFALTLSFERLTQLAEQQQNNLDIDESCD